MLNIITSIVLFMLWSMCTFQQICCYDLELNNIVSRAQKVVSRKDYFRDQEVFNGALATNMKDA